MFEGWEHKQWQTGLQGWYGPHGVCVVTGVDGKLYARLLTPQVTVTLPDPSQRQIDALVAFAETLQIP